MQKWILPQPGITFPQINLQPKASLATNVFHSTNGIGCSDALWFNNPSCAFGTSHCHHHVAERDMCVLPPEGAAQYEDIPAPGETRGPHSIRMSLRSKQQHSYHDLSHCYNSLEARPHWHQEERGGTKGQQVRPVSDFQRNDKLGN